jgi:hypothetical protein
MIIKRSKPQQFHHFFVDYGSNRALVGLLTGTIGLTIIPDALVTDLKAATGGATVTSMKCFT